MKIFINIFFNFIIILRFVDIFIGRLTIIFNFIFYLFFKINTIIIDIFEIFIQNKIVEVTIKKELNGNYDAIPTKNVIVDDNIGAKITSISIEQAYKLTHKKVRED